MKKYYLSIKGVLNPIILEKLGAPQTSDNKIKVLMCGFSEFDIPLGAIFNYMTIDAMHYKVDAILKFVTQQYNKPFQQIPAGWKTVCYVEFTEVYDFWKIVPIVDGFYDKINLKIEIGFDDSL